jgi:hypothetical protein
VNVRIIPRTALTGYLRLVRLPLDSAIGLLPGNGTGAGPAAGLVVDRADAIVRAIAATILNDPVLFEDAERRHAAANERERALRLRTEAQRETQEANARLAERQEETARRRQRAGQQEKEKRERAARERDEKVSRAASAERDRRVTSRQVAAQVDGAVEDLARKARLDTLDTKAEALRERDKALTAAEEARRLRDAASRRKAARKRR